MNTLYNFTTNFHFLRPWLLLLLLIPAGFYFVIFKNVNNLSSWEKVCDARLLKFLLIKGQAGKRKFSIFLLYLGFISAIFAAAGPTWNKKNIPALAIENPLMILLNLSSDMTESKLSMAKIDLSYLLNNVSESESGLIVYTNEPFLISPLSSDANLIINLLPAINADIMPVNGNRLDRAINLATDSIINAGYHVGNIVVVTADSSNGNARVAQAVKQAESQGITVNTIDVSNRNTQSLNRLIAKLQPQNANLSKSQNSNQQWEDYGWYFLFIPALCILYFFRRGILVILWILSLSNTAFAGFFFSDNQEGYKLFNQGKFTEARQKFTDSDWQASADYRSGNFAEATDLFGRKKDSESLYNKGNSLAKSGKIEEAIKTYEQVLAQEPEHEDAKFNLEYLKQQQQQNQNQKEQDNNQENEENQSQSQQNQENQNNTEQNQQDSAQSEQENNQKQSQEQNSSSANPQEDENNEQQNQQTDSVQQQQAPIAPTKEGDKDDEYDEMVQAREQQFREIPEDKGGLLRAFIYKEYMKNRYGE